MSLVAYDADSDSEVSDNDNEDIAEPNAPTIKSAIIKGKEDIDDHISDEEDFVGETTNGAAGFNADDDFFDSKEPDLLSLISEKLPNAKLKSQEGASFVDEKEDVASIPQKKDYGDKPEEPPAKKKKRQGPVQLVLPSLASLDHGDDRDTEQEKNKIKPSKTGSGLFSLLPAPKNSFSRKPLASVLQSEGVAKTPALTESPNENNLKPQGVRKVGLVPHRVANPVKPMKQQTKVNKSDSEEDDDDEDYLNVNSNSYFQEKETSKYPSPSLGSSININPVPAGSSSSSMRQDMYPRPASTHDYNYTNDDLGPAVAPYPPPAPSMPQPGQFVESDDAILRLAGKQNKLREMKEDPNMKIIDINEGDMRGDPRVWLTKAMTEEQAPRPTGKGPKGLAKSRHQITYLAHQAKERDWELRQEWATARENKRASANKYGF